MTDNMWVVTANVTDKARELGGTVETGLANWSYALFTDRAAAEEFDAWIRKQTIGGRLFTSQGITVLGFPDARLKVRFR